jgi:hypothetical protein
LNRDALDWTNRFAASATRAIVLIDIEQTVVMRCLILGSDMAGDAAIIGVNKIVHAHNAVVVRFYLEALLAVDADIVIDLEFEVT